MTSEARQIECPDCKRTMEVEERGGLRLVRLPTATPPARCCQRFASDGHTVTTAFSTPGT